MFICWKLNNTNNSARDNAGGEGAGDGLGCEGSPSKVMKGCPLMIVTRATGAAAGAAGGNAGFASTAGAEGGFGLTKGLTGTRGPRNGIGKFPRKFVKSTDESRAAFNQTSWQVTLEIAMYAENRINAADFVIVNPD